MQLAPLALRSDVPTTPRQDAAKALIAVPVGIAMVASMTAMTKSMAGQSASRADLVAPILEKMTAEQARGAMLGAIDGALTLAPELAPNADALRQAAEGVVALLTEAAGDTTQADPNASLERLTKPLEPLMGPIMEAALVLDPSLQGPGMSPS